MRLNKEKMESLARLSDGELWGEVRKMAGGYGIRLPEDLPREGELDKLRALLRSDSLNIGEAVRLVNEYRRKNGV